MMSLRLERLVYESTATGTTGSLTNLAAILSQSQRNNDRDGLTGVLAAHRERYVQVVEGTTDMLDSLLRRLERDPRHKELIMIGREPITARLFNGWSMASARITPTQGETLDRLTERGELTSHQIIPVMLDALNGTSAH